MTGILKVADLLSKIALVIAALLLVYVVVHILLETVLRTFLSQSTYVLDEFVGFAVLSISFLSLSYTLRADGMIRVNLLTARLSQAYQNGLEAVVSFIGSGFVGYFCVFLWNSTTKNWHRGAVSESVAEIPLWIPDAIVLFGAALLVTQLFLRGLAAVSPIRNSEREAY